LHAIVDPFVEIPLTKYLLEDGGLDDGLHECKNQEKFCSSKSTKTTLNVEKPK
jgi:hypothetical protein